MTQGFDEWFYRNSYHLKGYKCEYRFCFKEGAQSRQDEIDELKATIVKYEAGLRKNKANKHKLLAKNIELQKRIDEALIQVSNHYHSCVARKNLKRMSASISEIAEIEAHESNVAVLENILKGKEND